MGSVIAGAAGAAASDRPTDQPTAATVAMAAVMVGSGFSFLRLYVSRSRGLAPSGLEEHRSSEQKNRARGRQTDGQTDGPTSLSALIKVLLSLSFQCLPTTFAWNQLHLISKEKEKEKKEGGTGEYQTGAVKWTGWSRQRTFREEPWRVPPAATNGGNIPNTRREKADGQPNRADT